MIIRSLLRCPGTNVMATASKSPRSTFYSRFYSVMNAMQMVEEPENTEHDRTPASRRRLAKTTVLGLPSGKRISNEMSFKSEQVLDIEEGLGGLANLLRAIDHSISRSKRRLEEIYQVRARRRNALSATNINNNTPIRWKDDEEFLALTADAEQLERAMLQLRHNISLDRFKALSHAPNIRSLRANSSTLDSRVQNLLRLPCPDQLSALAKILSETRLAPSVKTFNIMISRLTRLRQNTAAWIVFQTMLKLKLTPDEHTISSVLNLSIVSGSYADFRKIIMASRRQKRIDKANDLDRKRHSRNYRGLVLFSTIIKGCIKFGHLRRAETYLTLMRAEKAQPNMEILTAMIKGYADKRDWESGRRHFEKIMTMDWDRKTVATLISYCRACKQPSSESQVRAVALIKGIETLDEKDDLAQLPIHWKTKGLDVPDHFKAPRRGDIGALGNGYTSYKNSTNKHVAGGSHSRSHRGRSETLFKGTRREALGKWA